MAIRQERKNIVVHTCRPSRLLYKADDMLVNERYFPTSDEFKDFRILPTKCNCRKKITLADARDRVSTGKAWYLWKKKNGRPLLLNGVDEESKCEAVLTLVERSQTPRVDMITAADIQRAFIGSERRTQWFIYSRIKKRYVRLPILLSDLELPDQQLENFWNEESNAEREIESINHRVAAEEIAKENRIRKQYCDYIDVSHEIMLESRAKLIAPFQDDPIPGRLLSPLY